MNTSVYVIWWVVGCVAAVTAQFFLIRFAVLSAMKSYATWKHEHGVEKRIHARDHFGEPWRPAP